MNQIPFDTEGKFLSSWARQYKNKEVTLDHLMFGIEIKDYNI